MTRAPISHGTDEHPDVTEISDLTDGLLPHEQSAHIQAHIEQCTLCAEVRESLEEIRSALGTLPGPARMPGDVAGRIDAALAAEALLDATTPTATPRPSAHPADVSRETPRTGPPGRPSGHAPAATGPGRPRARRRWRTALLTTAGAVTVFGLGAVFLQGLGPTGSGADDAGTSLRDTAGERGGTAAGLERRVQALVDRQEPRLKENESPGESASRSPGNDVPFADGATTVPSCVRKGVDRPEQPLAVDASKRYQGHPSYLIVLPHPGDPERVDAYVVDSRCATGSVSGPGEVLLQRTYMRD